MKIVYASTPIQEKKINDLIHYFYSTIFPKYFLDAEIMNFKQSKVLDVSQAPSESFGTLKEAYQVITCLQTIISILECNHSLLEYKATFYKNVQMLNEYGLHFPIQFDHFTKMNVPEENVISVFSKPDNEFLI
ncbi:DUF5365 family protein [Bacillus sp. 03113]|uniref:DUF5365 family protein n=1 Tax=Bacillus sp. 03113 TaxID=2578211 RepID=UPI001144DAF9|nr:DUF5365 family protein [Bacillus sp. 03113]